MNIEKTITPWGSWEVLLDADYCKAKRIIVNPSKRLSYQKHFKRSEVWTVVKGVAAITIDGTTKDYKVGDVAMIPQEAAHRITNNAKEPVVIIETQLGTYFGEDDIVRLKDKYGRC